MRLAFMGSPVFAVPTLSALMAAGHEIACVYSQPPKPAGRGQTLRATPVHQWAEEHGLPVRTPRSLKKAEAQNEFAALGLDGAIVVAYGLILPKAILAAPRLGCLNLHGSLLPRWRGAAPIQRAVMAGDAETGVQVMVMEEGLDTGPVLATATTAIGPEDTASRVHDRLAALGAPLMVQALQAFADGALTPQPQADNGVTYAAKITPEETRVDWTLAATAVDAKIRGLALFPGAWCTAPGEKAPVRLKLLGSRLAAGQGAPGAVLDDQLTIACGQGAIQVTRLQREGRQALDASDFVRGSPSLCGIVLS
jgi:methionyl-tRNA formyltransferase